MSFANALGKQVCFVIDRPLGSYNPEYPEMRYPVNYGYVPDETGGDGEEQDIYLLGVNKPVTSGVGRVVAVIHRLNDTEDKWVVVPDGMNITKEEIRKETHFQEQYFASEIYIL